MNRATTRSLRAEFEAYYADLKADARLEGYRVNKADEWERFLAAARDREAEGDAPVRQNHRWPGSIGG